MNLKNQGSFYLSTNNVREKPMLLTISGCREPDVTDPRRRPVVTFKEDGWALPLNKQNLQIVIEQLGWETNEWIGHTIEASLDPSVTFEGQNCGGVRVRVVMDPTSLTGRAF